MALTYRENSNPSIPASVSVKGAPLSNLEIDANFKSLEISVSEKATSDSPSFTGNVSGITGSMIVNTPGGGISSTTVQSAITELDAEKASLESPTFTGTVSGITGSMIVNTPSGGISSTNIQGAIDELTARELLTGQTGLANDPASIPAPSAGQSTWGTTLLGEVVHYIAGIGWVVVGNRYGVNTGFVPVSVTIPSSTTALYTIGTMPRDGKISIQMIVAGNHNSTLGSAGNNLVVFVMKNSTTIIQDRITIDNWYANAGFVLKSAADEISVVAGDVLTLSGFSGTISGTTSMTNRMISWKYTT